MYFLSFFLLVALRLKCNNIYAAAHSKLSTQRISICVCFNIKQVWMKMPYTIRSQSSLSAVQGQVVWQCKRDFEITGHQSTWKKTVIIQATTFFLFLDLRISNYDKVAKKWC